LINQNKKILNKYKERVDVVVQLKQKGFEGSLHKLEQENIAKGLLLKDEEDARHEAELKITELDQRIQQLEEEKKETDASFRNIKTQSEEFKNTIQSLEEEHKNTISECEKQKEVLQKYIVMNLSSVEGKNTRDTLANSKLKLLNVHTLKIDNITKNDDKLKNFFAN